LRWREKRKNVQRREKKKIVHQRKEKERIVPRTNRVRKTRVAAVRWQRQNTQ
jgi:hypothetical protein